MVIIFVRIGVYRLFGCQIASNACILSLLWLNQISRLNLQTSVYIYHHWAQYAQLQFVKRGVENEEGRMSRITLPDLTPMGWLWARVATSCFEGGVEMDG